MYFKLIFVAITFVLTISASLAQSQKHLLLHSDAIYFESGSDKVDAQFIPILEKVAKTINSNKKSSVWIQAHTDSLGSFDSNQILSDKRAQSVYQALFELGVDAAQLKMDSHGEYVPFISNGTAKGRALNRRVTIEVVEPYVPKPQIDYKCTIKGKVIDAQTQKALMTKIIFYSAAGKDSIETDSAGNYEYIVNQEIDVAVTAYAKGYFFVSKMTKAVDQKATEVNFFLEPAIIGGKMALNNLYFQGGTPLLMASSQKALEGVLAFMKFNTNLKIEIGGHINKPNQGMVEQSSSSFKLSESRAAVVYYYLIEHGISEDRLAYKGYGNSEMIHPNANTPVQEQMNRRVELKVIE